MTSAKPLKIAHVDTGLRLRGGQRQLLQLARRLRQRGHCQIIVCQEESELERRARAEEFSRFALPLHDPKHAYGILQLRQHLRDAPCDILHAHDGRGQTVAWLASIGMRVQRVASRRVTFLPRHRWAHRLKYAHTCDAVVTVSDFIRQLLIRSQVPESMIELIPDGIEIPPELEAYKAVVGKAFLKLNKNVRTVLAKAGAVSGTYRLRELSIVAGEMNTATVHKEHGCQYYVDLAKAYFSPRLSFEHHRVASLVREGETVLDMFAGVGPFAIQIAKAREKVKVYAVDANPSAIEFLEKNVRLNRVEDKVVPILGDAKEVVKQRLSGVGDRVIMNLPERATEFVCAACRALRPSGGMIHFYGFVEASESLENMQAGFAQSVEHCGRRVEKVLFSRLVRATAPYEWQFVLDAKIV
jgi:tRNA (guanine37-N1)-methyltransferase